MGPEEQLALITANLQEVLDVDIIRDILFNEKRPLRIYWGTAPTGRPHVAYFKAMLKVADFLRAGCHVKILVADLHAVLDNLKAPIEQVDLRAEYYQRLIIAMLDSFGIREGTLPEGGQLEFVRGRSHQESGAYFIDLLKMCTITSENDAKRAGTEVVKQVENPLLSGLVYPLMQSLDEHYLGVDAQLGGVDQRKIFILAKDLMPRMGFKMKAHLMNPILGGLTGKKMSASEAASKIDVLDTAEDVRKKMKSAFGEPKVVDGNPVLGLVEHILLPASVLKTGKAQFKVERREGEPIIYDNIEAMRKDYEADVLTPQLLKPAAATGLVELLAPIRAAFEADNEWQDIAERAYAVPLTPEEKAKKAKKEAKQKKMQDKSKKPNLSMPDQKETLGSGQDLSLPADQDGNSTVQKLKMPNEPEINGTAEKTLELR